MRLSYLKHLLLLSFLLVASSLSNAVIVVPQFQTVSLNHYESEPFELSQNATLNILPGGSAELYQHSGSTTANLNILGGEVRNGITGTSEVPDITMTGGYFVGVSHDAADSCSINILGGTVGSYGLDSTCSTTIQDGVIEGVTKTQWGGGVYIYGGIFQSRLESVGTGFFEIHGGIFEVPELYTSDYLSQIDFYGHGLSMTDPVLLNIDFSEAQYNTRVTGYLSDGNFIDMSVTYIVNGEYGGVTLHNLPEPSTLILIGAGILGIGVTRLWRTK